MRKPILLLTLFAFTSSLVLARDHGKGNWSGVSIHTGDGASGSCDDSLDIRDADNPYVARSEEIKTVANTALRITAAHNGGISVRPGATDKIELKLCKLAAGTSDASAHNQLGQIALRINGNNVEVAGPEGHASWVALIIVTAPAGATLDLSAHNGGISLFKINANITARTVNGGISLRETSGKMDVEARNGGISIKDAGGDVHVNVTNGGISVTLADRWQGAGLEARGQNGGVSVSLPSDYHSSLEVASLGHGPIRCRGGVCRLGSKDWDDNDHRYFRIGQNPIVRISTVNGGISISDRGTANDDED